MCCDNETYCIIDNDWNQQCCPLGSDCGESAPCGQNFVALNITATATTTIPAGSETTTTVTTLLGCSPRACTGTNYECPSSIGGGCCPYGFDCASNGCLTLSAASTAGAGGCANNQFQCGGNLNSTVTYCCGSEEACTSTTAQTITLNSLSNSLTTLAGGYACESLAQIVAGFTSGTGTGTSSLQATDTATGSVDSSTASGVDRSKALKIGLGVVIPLALLCIGGLVFFTLWKRKTRRLERTKLDHSTTAGLDDYGKAELPNEPVQRPVELDAYVHNELVAGKGQMAELAGQGITAELPNEESSKARRASGRYR